MSQAYGLCQARRVRPLGIVHVAFGGLPLPEASARAKALGFDHIDTTVYAVGEPCALPIGEVCSPREPRAGCTWLAPTWRDEGSFDFAVRRLREHPGARVEVGPRSVAGSVASARALVDAVPGLRLCVDTGHVTTWGEDPIDLLDLAGHVQLRQAAPGIPQLHPDDQRGAVDFRAVLRRLDDLGYDGLVSVEYFNLPELGFALDADPVEWCTVLAAQVRAL
jgi:sugar phosphate isomerase/epimerase